MTKTTFVYLFALICNFGLSQCKINTKHIISVDNVKDYKKVLKTHTNVLTLYSKDDKSALNTLKWMDGVAKEIKGKGTIVYINCGENKESKKLCKKYGVSPNPKELKHYKDGTFNKNYDRKENEKSLLTFMTDPMGDAPWEEDPNSKSIVHVSSEKDLNKLRRKEKGQLLIMFYAPWCGYCKKLKPDYAGAALALKGKSVLAAMDVDKPDAFNVRYQFNITGFPTLIYFENGNEKFRYGGKMDKEGIIKWLEDPKPESEAVTEATEKWEAPEISHLDDETFNDAVKKNPSMLVMFYAPWCGHCKKLKPEYVNAAKTLQEETLPATLAAVDCTQSTEVCKRFNVSGYPTLNYYADGEYKFKASMRSAQDIVTFMQDPKEPPPPPPLEKPWAETSADLVLHLTDANFKEELKKRKHVLVMFYAPWCGHCKKAKPEIETAAEKMKENRKVTFAAVDCTQYDPTCKIYDVSGFPTFRYFSYGKKDFAYEGGRYSDDLINFMNAPTEPVAHKEPTVEEWSDTPSSVIHLNEETFDDYINSHASVMVMFYAPWCGHCKAMKPAYMEAAHEVLHQDHDLCAVDCTKNRVACGRHNVAGYPTLKHFLNGVSSEYQGGREKEDIVTFLTGIAMTSQPSQTHPEWEDYQDVFHLTDDTFSRYIEENPAILVMFYAPWCGHCKKMKPSYNEAAKIVNTEKLVDGKLVAIDCTKNSLVCDMYGIKGYPTLKYFKNGVKFLEYKGRKSAQDIVEFMKDPKEPPPKPAEVPWADENTDVLHLTEESFDAALSQHTSLLVMFYAPWCGHCKRMKPQYAEAAKTVNIKNEVPGTLAALDCTLHRSVCKKYDVKGFPTVKYFKTGEEIEKYRGGRDAGSFIEYMKSPSQQAKDEKQTEWSDEVSAIRHLDAETFAESIKNIEVLVMFYAPWCGHCNRMKKDYTAAANQLKEEGFPGFLAAIDATKANDISKQEGVQGFPTLRFYRNGVFANAYDGQRTTEDLKSFMRAQLESDDKRESELDKEDWENIPSSVVHLTRNNFKPYMSGKRHVLVMYYVKWCTNCLEKRGHMMQAASRLSDSPTFGLAAVNCDKQTDFCQEIGVATFPALKYYADGAFVENYSSVTKPSELVNYMRSKVKEEL